MSHPSGTAVRTYTAAMAADMATFKEREAVVDTTGFLDRGKRYGI